MLNRLLTGLLLNLLLLKKIVHFHKHIIRKTAQEWGQGADHRYRVTLLVSRDDLLLDCQFELAIEGCWGSAFWKEHDCHKKHQYGF